MTLNGKKMKVKSWSFKLHKKKFPLLLSNAYGGKVVWLEFDDDKNNSRRKWHACAFKRA
jgi:hypothetical protein